jgi:hypothetical protein
MGFPKKIKKTINLSPEKILYERREQLLEFINQDGTYLPKSLLHADLDGGFLDFVRDDLRTVVNGKVIPTINTIITTQNWAQFAETFMFQNMDKNPEPPFIVTIRTPEVKYGSNPSLLYTIPNRREYFYAAVPNWDGSRKGLDIYKIPQPVPVDINYQVKIVCNRMRELNQFNKIVLQKYSSRQSYMFIKGHYIPTILNNISNNSELTLDKRKYYVQTYDFTTLGFLIDEEEFEVAPAVSRVLTMMETDTSIKKKKVKKFPENPDTFPRVITFAGSATTQQLQVDYTGDFTFVSSDNVDSYDVYINGDFYGSDVPVIQINTNDILRIDITKSTSTTSTITYEITLL